MPAAVPTAPEPPTWKEYAGRAHGGDSYEFGDIMRGLRWRTNGGNSSQEAGSGGSDFGEQRYLQEIAIMRAALEEQQAATAEASRRSAAAQQWGLLLGLLVAFVLELSAWSLSALGVTVWATRLFWLLGLLIVGAILFFVLRPVEARTEEKSSGTSGKTT
mmetsp:Transcript_141468/g.368541  ORF Transcript_141468/g.368541 Transcript_141468/m.368541 type:complete len:160 (+) Transcript_141468:83-562(+)